MNWVLIVVYGFLTYNSSVAKEISFQEFETKAKCEYAARVIRSTVPNPHEAEALKLFCVEK